MMCIGSDPLAVSHTTLSIDCNQQLNFPTGTNIPEVTSMGIGMGFTFLLMFLRMRFFWWPFHAVGYAVSGAADWCMNWPLDFARD